MVVFGIGVFVVTIIALIVESVVSFNKKDGLALGLSIFFLCFISLCIGFILSVGWNTTYADNLPLVTQPDTLIVTGYVLEVDTVKVGE